MLHIEIAHPWAVLLEVDTFGSINEVGPYSPAPPPGQIERHDKDTVSAPAPTSPCPHPQP